MLGWGASKAAMNAMEAALSRPVVTEVAQNDLAQLQKMAGKNDPTAISLLDRYHTALERQANSQAKHEFGTALAANDLSRISPQTMERVTKLAGTNNEADHLLAQHQEVVQNAKQGFQNAQASGDFSQAEQHIKNLKHEAATDNDAANLVAQHRPTAQAAYEDEAVHGKYASDANKAIKKAVVAQKLDDADMQTAGHLAKLEKPYANLSGENEVSVHVAFNAAANGDPRAINALKNNPRTALDAIQGHLLIRRIDGPDEAEYRQGRKAVFDAIKNDPNNLLNQNGWLTTLEDFKANPQDPAVRDKVTTLAHSRDNPLQYVAEELLNHPLLPPGRRQG